MARLCSLSRAMGLGAACALLHQVGSHGLAPESVTHAWGNCALAADAFEAADVPASCVAAARLLLKRLTRRMSPTTPSGKNSVTPMNKAPKKYNQNSG